MTDNRATGRQDGAAREVFHPGYIAAALGVLRYNWGDCYLIRENAGTWTAERSDDRSVLTAFSPHELREAIVADYTARPVPR